MNWIDAKSESLILLGIIFTNLVYLTSQHTVFGCSITLLFYCIWKYLFDL